MQRLLRPLCLALWLCMRYVPPPPPPPSPFSFSRGGCCCSGLAEGLVGRVCLGCPTYLPTYPVQAWSRLGEMGFWLIFFFSLYRHSWCFADYRRFCIRGRRGGGLLVCEELERRISWYIKEREREIGIWIWLFVFHTSGG